MIGIIRVFLIFASIAAASVLFIQQVLEIFQGTKGLKRKYISLLQDVLDEIPELIPESKEELALLSINGERKKIRRKGKKIIRGVYNTIFHEKLISFAQLPINRYRRLTVVRTSNREFVFDEYQDSVEITSKGQNLGRLSSGGKYIGSDESPLVQLDWLNSKDTIPLEINDKVVAQLANVNYSHSSSVRFFQSIPDMDHKELEIILALSFYYLVVRK